MTREDDHIPNENAPDSALTGKRRKRGSVRPAMRREFMELFRDTRAATSAVAGVEAPLAVPPAAVATPDAFVAAGVTPALPGAGQASLEPSRYLRRFLQQSHPAPEPARSGLVTLDAWLGGGFAPGMHLLLGTASGVKTAFLEALAWEAVGTRRPVLYFTLRAGSLRVWERLISTMGTIMDVPAVAPAALRGRELVPDDLENLARLDSALQAAVLPYLTLIDRPARGGDLSAFVTSLRSYALEATEKHGRLPLVLIDGLDEVLAFTGSLPPELVIARLDEALAADSLPGVVAAGSLGSDQEDGEGLPGQSTLSLEVPAPGPAMLGGRLDLKVLKNPATGSTGDLRLLLDPSSGLFAEA
jgi:hypothetical protein